MAENKTQFTDASVEDFIKAIPDENKREDTRVLLNLMEQVSGYAPKMYGEAIIGFGQSHYKYESGREGDSPRIAFSPRKQNLTLYIDSRFHEQHELLEKLGKHKTGKVCLYINKLADIHLPTLQKLIEWSLKVSE